MFFLNSSLDDVLSSILPCDSKIKDRIERSETEVDLIVEIENEVKKLKIFDASEVKEKRILKFLETQSLLSECSLPFINPSKIHQISDNVMMYERSYYCCDLKSIICTKCLNLNEISSIMIRLSEILMILCECDICVSNVNSNNIIYKNNEVNLVDLCLNELRREEDMRMDNVCYRSPEELSGSELNDKSVIWSLGCILYEMLNKELPFNEENDMNKTLNNIMKCKLNDDIKIDDEMMKEILDRMLKVENEDRLSLMEFNKEMIKENEKLENKNNLMICNEKEEIIFNNDMLNEIFPFVNIQSHVLMKNKEYEKIRDDVIELYSSKPNERILSILLMIKLHKEQDYSIERKLKYQIDHQCKYRKEECYLDRMIFNSIKFDYEDKEIIIINWRYICLCEEAMNYFFRIIKLINPTKLKFCDINIPIQFQPLFGYCFSQLSNLQELDLWNCHLTFHFIESFIKSIPIMKKLKYVNLWYNPIDSTGFKLLLPYLHLLINKDNELDIYGMNLNDESISLLLEYKNIINSLSSLDISYNRISDNEVKILSNNLNQLSNLKRLDISYNNISDFGIISLSEEISCLKKLEYLNINGERIEYNGIKSIFKNSDNNFKLKTIECDILKIGVLEDDEILKSYKFEEIEKLDLNNNKLTSESIEILINNLSSFPNLEHLWLNGNAIGDIGMKILSPHLHLLRKYDSGYNRIDCSKMRLSSEGLKYLLDGLKNIHENIKLNIRENNIDSSGIEYLMNCIKENDHIKDIFIHNNPIGNDGFKLLLNILDMLRDDDYPWEIVLNNISIDDESVTLLTNKLDSVEYYNPINLSGNNISFYGLKSICEKSMESDKYPFIEMKSSNWRNEELEYYLDYCTKKKKIDIYRYYDFSKVNLNDSHISLIKQIDYYQHLDLSNNKLSFKGLKELTDSLPKHSEYISIYGNEIGDEGVEIICKYFDKFVDYYSSLNLLDIGMSEKGLKMLIERLKEYKTLEKIDISGNELNEEELRIMKENKEIFEYLEELSITIKEDINKNELKSFLERFSCVRKIKLNGINEEEKK